MPKAKTWTKSLSQQRSFEVRDGQRFNRYASLRRRMEYIWDLVKHPVKFPAPPRRRREDREIPKAA
jgi:hypothetical protein